MKREAVPHFVPRPPDAKLPRTCAGLLSCFENRYAFQGIPLPVALSGLHGSFQRALARLAQNKAGLRRVGSPVLWDMGPGTLSYELSGLMT